ncbi:MAG: PqqD family protein [Ruminococcaceae bacterium]|nr:PqqD family protein [Oscillospiraceae bacterium]
MMKKNNSLSKNYLDRIPKAAEHILWDVEEKGIVTLSYLNKGVFNRVAQKLLKKPKKSYIHLDENGSFTWQQIDGEKDIFTIGKAVDEHFGEAAHPLYERLVKFFQILDSYGFIVWVKK